MEPKSIKKPSKNRCGKRSGKRRKSAFRPGSPTSRKHIQVNKTHKASEGNPHELGEESAEESAERSMQRENTPRPNTPRAPKGPERIYWALALPGLRDIWAPGVQCRDLRGGNRPLGVPRPPPAGSWGSPGVPEVRLWLAIRSSIYIYIYRAALNQFFLNILYIYI